MTTKLSDQSKADLINAVLAGKLSSKEAAKMAKVSYATLRLWVRSYQEEPKSQTKPTISPNDLAQLSQTLHRDLSILIQQNEEILCALEAQLPRSYVTPITDNKEKTHVTNPTCTSPISKP